MSQFPNTSQNDNSNQNHRNFNYQAQPRINDIYASQVIDGPDSWLLADDDTILSMLNEQQDAIDSVAQDFEGNGYDGNHVVSEQPAAPPTPYSINQDAPQLAQPFHQGYPYSGNESYQYMATLTRPMSTPMMDSNPTAPSLNMYAPSAHFSLRDRPAAQLPPQEYSNLHNNFYPPMGLPDRPGSRTAMDQIMWTSPPPAIPQTSCYDQNGLQAAQPPYQAYPHPHHAFSQSLMTSYRFMPEVGFHHQNAFDSSSTIGTPTLLNTRPNRSIRTATPKPDRHSATSNDPSKRSQHKDNCDKRKKLKRDKRRKLTDSAANSGPAINRPSTAEGSDGANKIPSLIDHDWDRAFKSEEELARDDKHYQQYKKLADVKEEGEEEVPPMKQENLGEEDRYSSTFPPLPPLPPLLPSSPCYDAASSASVQQNSIDFSSMKK